MRGEIELEWLSFFAGGPSSTPGVLRFGCPSRQRLLSGPPSTLRGGDPCATCSTHRSTPSRANGVGGCGNHPAAAPDDAACRLLQVWKLSDKRSELRLEFLVSLLGTTTSELQDRAGMFRHA